MTQQWIEIKHLELSPLNVRRSGTAAAMEELKASIAAHGLMQNLIVVEAKKGGYLVIAGGRRLEALRSLQAESRLPADYRVPCRLVEAARACELSLAENVVRQAMNPADEFEAFAALIGKKQSAAQVAERFGVTERHVLQRMKLGRVAPKLLEAFRAGDVTLDALMAFAVTDDHKRQLSVWKSLEGWQRNNARHIRSLLTEAMLDADDQKVKFVGLKAYKAAGGTVKADLFTEAAYLEDAALVERLAGEKLEAEAAKLRSEGWGWVQVEQEDDGFSVWRCGRIHAKPVDAPAELTSERERLAQEAQEIEDAIDATEDDDELEVLYDRCRVNEEAQEELAEKLEAYATFDPDEMKNAGCYVSIDRQGKLDIERGLVKPEDRKVTYGADGEAASGKKEKPEFSQSLVADMKAYRAQVAQVEIASHPDIAFDLLVFHAACGVLDHVAPGDGPDVHFRQSYPRPSVEAKNAATERLESIRAALPVAWLEQEGEDARFAAFRQLAEADKRRILAYCTALTLKPDLAGDGEFPSAYEVALSLTGGSVAGYWRPTKDNYLSRVSRAQLLDIGRAVYLGGDEWAVRRRDAKKAALVEELHADFARSHLPVMVDKLRNWLPKGMGFRAAASAEPVKHPEKRGRKPKKAA